MSEFLTGDIMGKLAFYRSGLYKDVKGEGGIKETAMGVWNSPAVDVSPAFSVIGEINSGMLGSFMRPLEGNDVELLYSLNGTDYNRLKNGFIENAEQLNDNPSLWLRAIIRSYVSTISKEFSPELYIVTIILSNKKREFWETEVEIPLKWGEN